MEFILFERVRFVSLAFGAMYSSGIKHHNRQMGKVGKYQRGKLGTVVVLFSFVCLMVFNTTFNNISTISWRSVLLVEETEGP